MKILNLLLCLIVTLSSAFGAETPVPCPAPASGPAWLEDFKDFQKKKLDVEWEVEEGIGTYSLDGTYTETTDEKKEYKDYEHKSSLDAKEKWQCVAGKEPTFVTVTGEVETNLEWKKQDPQQEEKFESEDNFQILAIDNYRHVKHQSEKKLEINNGITKKTVETETNWKQTWDKDGVPTIQGKTEMESEEVSIMPPKAPRQLASAVVVPGFQPKALPAGRTLKVEVEQEGKMNGPIDPVEVQSKQKITQLEGETLIEEKEVSLKQNNYFLFDPKKKSYDFLNSTEFRMEKTKNHEQKSMEEFARLESWSDPNQPADKVSSWKWSFKPSKFGKTSSFRFESAGHDVFPEVLGVKAKNGSYSRITEYNTGGYITRFLVLYFPPGNNGNKTLMDLHFAETGSLKEVNLDDDSNFFELYPDPFGDPSALYALQSRINALKDAESVKGNRSLPERTPVPSDYPTVYVAPPKK